MAALRPAPGAMEEAVGCSVRVETGECPQEDVREVRFRVFHGRVWMRPSDSGLAAARRHRTLSLYREHMAYVNGTLEQ